MHDIALAPAYVLAWAALALYAAHLARPGRILGRAATTAALAGWAVLLAGLVLRGRAAGHWPLAAPYEFALTVAWAILGGHLVLEARGGERRWGAFVLAGAVLFLTYAFLRPAEERALRPLLPALRSVWLQIHAISAALGYAAWAIAAGLAAFGLLAERFGTEDAPAEAAAAEAAAAEAVLARGVAWGVLLMGAGMLSGAIWAREAWGRYWGWDPKEAWALVTWLWHLLILHLYAARGWRGRRLAIAVLAGFAIVLLAFAGLPWLVRIGRLETLHGF